MLVTRFAPSPTGLLHLGHAFSALTAQNLVQKSGGRLVLRIEDIDHTRCRPEFEHALVQDLAWIGLQWEEPVRRQSEHLEDYRNALGALQSQGLVYRCFRTRKQVLEEISQAPHGPTEVFRGQALPEKEEALRLADEEPFAWRLSLDQARKRLGPSWGALTYLELGPDDDLSASGQTKSADPEITGDVVLARKDLGVAYHLAVVVDDALQGVTHVVRGEDLREAVPIQRLLQALLGLPAPIYLHHPLIRSGDGERLAKRAGSKSLAEHRQEGLSPFEIRRILGLEYEKAPALTADASCKP